MTHPNGQDSSSLPDPLVPIGCDLTSYPYIPLKITRLFNSMAWLDRKGTKDSYEIFTLRLSLWLKSWHEVPAASLPNDERVLADRAQCEMRRWRQVRDRVMQGFVLCSDNRFYHKVVAEIALESWENMINGNAKHAKEAEKMRRWRAAKAARGSGGDDPGAGSAAPRNPPRNGNGNGNAHGNVDGNVDGYVTSINRKEEKGREEEYLTGVLGVPTPAREAVAAPGQLGKIPIPEPAPAPPPAPPFKAAEDPTDWHVVTSRPPPEPRPPQPDIPPSHQPSRSARPDFWIPLASTVARPDLDEHATAVTDEGMLGGTVKGTFLHIAANAVCDAARIYEANFRGWTPLVNWLRDDRTLDDHILPAIKWAASRDNYEPPHSLMGFDGLVRSWRKERTG